MAQVTPSTHPKYMAGENHCTETTQVFKVVPFFSLKYFFLHEDPSAVPMPVLFD